MKNCKQKMADEQLMISALMVDNYKRYLLVPLYSLQIHIRIVLMKERNVLDYETGIQNKVNKICFPMALCFHLILEHKLYNPY